MVIYPLSMDFDDPLVRPSCDNSVTCRLLHKEDEVEDMGIEDINPARVSEENGWFADFDVSNCNPKQASIEAIRKVLEYRVADAQYHLQQEVPGFSGYQAKSPAPAKELPAAAQYYLFHINHALIFLSAINAGRASISF